MQVWHIGASANIAEVNGLARTTQDLCTELSLLGIEVTMLLHYTPDSAEVEHWRARGIRLLALPSVALGVNGQWIRAVISRIGRPDVVHMHSTFVPAHGRLGRLLRGMRIPYVVAPHGSFHPEALCRSRAKKMVYAGLVERHLVRGAWSVLCLTSGEAEDVRGFAGKRASTEFMDLAISSPVPIEQISEYLLPAESPTREEVRFFGRLDVVHKGLDFLAQTASVNPDLNFRLYGPIDVRYPRFVQQVLELGNVFWEPPIHGANYLTALSQSGCVFFPSRWEGFPVVMAEAMLLNVPVVAGDWLHCARYAGGAQACQTFPRDPVLAGEVLRKTIRGNSRVDDAAVTDFVKRFSPQLVARRAIQIYREAAAGTP